MEYVKSDIDMIANIIYIDIVEHTKETGKVYFKTNI